jgi:hypothetical protein
VRRLILSDESEF